MRMKTTRLVDALPRSRPPKDRRAKPRCHECGQKHEPDEAHAPPTLVLPPGFIGRVVRFSSGSPVNSHLRKLSNFHRVRVSVSIGGATLHFPSSEHAYVYHSVTPNVELTCGGSFASFAGLRAIEEQLDRPIGAIAEYWTDDRIGVVAKLVGNCARKMRGPSTMDIDQKRSLWMAILRSKFRDPEMRCALLDTGDSHLVEYCKGAVRRQRIGIAPERWGGWDHTPEDGSGVAIWGENNMGSLLMTVRGEIRGELAETRQVGITHNVARSMVASTESNFHPLGWRRL